MDKTITTGLMITASMIMVLMLFNIAYPAIIEGGDSITRMASRAQDRMNSGISIVHATSELDSSGYWNDGSQLGDFEVFVWVKNIGITRITGLPSMDVFFGEQSDFVRIPHQSTAGGAMPYWVAEIEGESDWNPSSTLKITIHYPSELVVGRYFIKITTPVGVSDDYFIGL